MDGLVEYKIKMATERDIFLHLVECSSTFTPPLAERVDIGKYARKISENAMTFEAWEKEALVGIIASYFPNCIHGSAFITNVSVLRRFTKMGIASKLLGMCIEYAIRNKCSEITLEVHKNNHRAVLFYQKSGFGIVEMRNDVILMRRNIEWMTKEITTEN